MIQPESEAALASHIGTLVEMAMGDLANPESIVDSKDFGFSHARQVKASIEDGDYRVTVQMQVLVERALPPVQLASEAVELSN
jgi:hypothetical protein